MKSAIKESLVKVFILFTRLIRLIFSPSQVVVICPPFPNNINIGDRGLVLGAISELYKTNKRITLVQMTDSHVPPFPEYPEISINGEHVTLFKVYKNFRATIAWTLFLRKAKRVFLIGADSIDEYYSRSDSMAKLYAARIAGMLGINTNIMSFSINEVTHGLKDTMSELPNNVSLVARDPVSFKRLQDKNIPKIHCSSDLSYLFKPSSVRNDERLQAYLKNKEGKLIGFSFNNLLFSAKEDNAARFDFYAAAICGLIERSNMSIILIPNNVKDSTKYSLELNRRIEQRCPGSTFLTEYLGDPAELKALMSKCRYYFSTTLHMGLFPLGVGVPTTCFPYAGKFDGPLSLLGIPDSLIEVEDIPEDPSAFSEILYHHFTKADERKKQIDQNLGSVINLAKVNLVDFTQ